MHAGSSIVPLHSVSAQEPAIIRQALPLANCATTQIQIHLRKHANTGTQTHRQVKGPTGNLQYFLVVADTQSDSIQCLNFAKQ